MVTDLDGDVGHLLSVDDSRFEIVTIGPDKVLKLKDAEPLLDFETESTINLVVTATDDDGLFRSEAFVISVNDLNDDPVAGADVAATPEDQILNVDAANGLLNNASDEDTLPTPDTLSITPFVGSSTLGAAVTINADGSYTYDPTGSATLQALLHDVATDDTFTYTVDDGQGGISIPATVTVTVTGNGIVRTGDTSDPAGATLIVGDITLGTLDIFDTAVVNSTTGIVGNQSTGNGTVTITGAGSAWNIDIGNLTVYVNPKW